MPQNCFVCVEENPWSLFSLCIIVWAQIHFGALFWLCEVDFESKNVTSSLLKSWWLADHSFFTGETPKNLNKKCAQGDGDHKKVFFLFGSLTDPEKNGFKEFPHRNFVKKKNKKGFTYENRILPLEGQHATDLSLSPFFLLSHELFWHSKANFSFS